MTDVTPIFSVALPNQRRGLNRGTVCNQLAVETDGEAVQVFLSQCKSEDTLRCYRREINRLLTWALYVPRKSLSDLMAADLSQYAKFLADPPTSWINKTVQCADGTRAKLFLKPLSQGSQHYALTVTKSFLSFLVRYGYLQTLPIFKNNIARGPSSEVQRRRIKERQLDPSQHRALFQWFDQNPGLDSDRVRFLASLMLFMGLRIHEVASHRMSHFLFEDGVWLFQVTGKGQKYEELVAPPRLIEELKRFRLRMGLSELPGREDGQPLAMAANGGGIGVRRISQLVKDAVVGAATLLPDGRPKDEMRSCSPHWFRHMFVDRLAQSGMRLQDIKKLARHSKLDTTMLYMDSIRQEREANMQSFDYDDVLQTNESSGT